MCLVIQLFQTIEHWQKISEILDNYVQSIIKSGVCYIKNISDSLSKLKNLRKLPKMDLL